MASLGERALAASQALEVATTAETAQNKIEEITTEELPPAECVARPDDSAGRDSAADAGISRDARGISDAAAEVQETAEATDEAAPGDQNPILVHTQSSPALASDAMPLPLRRAHSDDTAVSPEIDVEPREKRRSDATSVESNDSDGAASSASVVPTPPAALPAKSSSYKATRRDAPLRIFFPTEDLAMKAILSPPTLRNAPARTQSASQLTSEPAKPTLAESFLETTSRLFFLRGNSNSNSPTKPTADAAETTTTTGDTAPARAGRPSTTSIALEEDLSKLNNAIVAANPNLPPPPFANMFSCENCHEDIGSLLTQGRHHCRNCGGSFCATCSSKTSIVPFQLYLSKGEQRVCDGCFNRIREFHAQAQTTQITWSGLSPPQSDVLAREFDLAPHETPVTVFNCSYFVDFAPFYGHLFFTREHVCFRGYKTHKIKIAFTDLHSLIKPEFYYINALQINTKSTKEKHFFAEFNGLRDLAFLRLDQLVRAFQDGKKKELSGPLSSEMLKQQAIGRRRSYKVLAAAAGSDDLASFMAASTGGFHDVDDEDDDESDKRSNVAFSEDHDEAMSTGSSASDESAEPIVPDALLTKMTGLLDCDLRTDTQSVFEFLWGNDQGRDFLRDHMEKTKDIDIEIEDWQPITSANEAETAKGFAISKENDYSLFRNVRSKHPPKTKFPGLPPYAGCCRLQRLRIEKSVDGSKWTRFVVADLLRMSGIPFSDYFEIETRWVFTRDGKNYCHVQAGLIVNFIKSTWFKSQIDSSTRSESKEGLEHWAKNAIVFLQDHVGSGGLVPRASIDSSVGSATPRSATSEEAGDNSRRLSTTSEPRPRSVKRPSVVLEAPVTPSSTMSVDLSSLLANPQSLLQFLTLVVLLYCVVVIRSQQVQLERLSETTSRLLAQLNAPSNAGVSGNVCEQSIVDGAVASLHRYFQSQQAHH